MDDLIIVQLNPKQAKQYIMMQFLDSLNVFDIKSGSVTIHFTPTGEIGDVQITRKYKPKKEVPLDSVAS